MKEYSNNDDYKAEGYALKEATKADKTNEPWHYRYVGIEAVNTQSRHLS